MPAPAAAELTGLKPETQMEVSEVRERASFAALEKEWNELVSATLNQPFHRHEFIRIWLDNFAPGKPIRILVARANGRLVAALPLIEQQTSFFGVPVRQLSSAANVHSCRFDLLAENPEVAARAFFQHLANDDRWSVLKLTDVPEGGNAWQLYKVAQEFGWPAGGWESMRSPHLLLPSDYRLLEIRLTAKFRANLRRRRRKIDALGQVALERVDGWANLDAKLEEGLWLERQGWKGQRGTAIAQETAARGFYTELARAAAYRRYLSLYFLRLNGTPIAFHFGLVGPDQYFLLKPTYAESLRECSPGQVLMEAVLRDTVSRGLREFDFLGPEMAWKRDWADGVQSHSWLFLFRDSKLGRALCRAKFSWVPQVRKLSRWIRPRKL
jgi:CelD/BcsL family acetyltransferase involved in cellulose biosynthesis